SDGGARQRDGRACARLRRHAHRDERPSLRARVAGAPRTRRHGGRGWTPVPHRAGRRHRARVPARRAPRWAALRDRLPFDRYRGHFRRGCGLCPSPRPGRGRLAPRDRPRGQRSGGGGGRAPHHGPAAARPPRGAGGGAGWPAGGGFTAAPDVLETPQGFAATHAGATPDPSALDKFAGRFLIRATLFKYHASCYLTHAAIEAARQLRAEHAIDPHAVESVVVTVAPSLLGVCNIAEPRTGLEGKFSLRATTALALLGEDTGAVATYSDAKMADAPVVRLRDRVRVEVDRGLSATRARVALVASARRFENEADTGVPAADLAAQRPRLRAKFDTLAGAVLGSRPAGELAETALGVDRLSSLGDLVRRLGA